jgi:thiamine-monophosphate kinase
MDARLLRDVGEKALISDVIRPLLNPARDQNSVGDDCAVFQVPGGGLVCASTDRVPADLVSYKLGIIDIYGLGSYLAVLNLSDIAAMGAEPRGLLLNLALPEDMSVEDLKALLTGAKDACGLYGTAVLGGDLSSASELSISATAIGYAEGNVLRRFGSTPGDYIYCTRHVGLTSTAFAYFLRAGPRGLWLEPPLEGLLKDQFRKPHALFEVAAKLRAEQISVTAMDNTDGVGQTLSELAALNEVAFVIDPNLLPIHPVTKIVAEYLGEDMLDLALGPGADFQLLGTLPGSCDAEAVAQRCGVFIVGEVRNGNGVSKRVGDGLVPIKVTGWSYYSQTEKGFTQGDDGTGSSS